MMNVLNLSIFFDFWLLFSWVGVWLCFSGVVSYNTVHDIRASHIHKPLLHPKYTLHREIPPKMSTVGKNNPKEMTESKSKKKPQF